MTPVVIPAKAGISTLAVIPAKAGISLSLGHGMSPRDPGLRRGDALGGAS